LGLVNAREHPMLDLVLLGGGLIFMIVTIAYAYACNWL
jgi:hypothetical protein